MRDVLVFLIIADRAHKRYCHSCFLMNGLKKTLLLQPRIKEALCIPAGCSRIALLFTTEPISAQKNRCIWPHPFSLQPYTAVDLYDIAKIRRNVMFSFTGSASASFIRIQLRCSDLMFYPNTTTGVPTLSCSKSTAATASGRFTQP